MASWKGERKKERKVWGISFLPSFLPSFLAGNSIEIHRIMPSDVMCAVAAGEKEEEKED